MNRHDKQKNPNPYAKYKKLLEECVEIKYDDLKETIRRVNEIAVSLLDITCSSVWILSEIDKTLQCKDIYIKKLKKHTSKRSPIELSKHYAYIDALKQNRHLRLRNEETELDLQSKYLVKNNIREKFDTAVYYNDELKGILTFESTYDREFVNGFTREVAVTLANIIEIAIHIDYKHEKEEIFEAIAENAYTGILIFRNYIIYANEAASVITGYPLDELKRMHTWDFVDNEAKELFKQRVLKRLKGDYFSINYNDIPIRTKNGTYKIVRATVETIVYEGKYAGLAIVTDVTDLIEAKEKLRILAQAVEQTDEFVKITDIDGEIIYVNNSLIASTGYKEIELIGQNPRIFKSGKHPKSFYKELWNTILAKKVYRNVIINKKKDGTLYYEDQTISPILDKNGEIIYFVATSKDVSSQIELESKLKMMATTDALTGIFNRYKMNEEIESEIKKAKRYNRSFTLIMFDIDFFKIINDTYGHDVGDKVLEELTQIVSETIRQTDTFARWGGEEFMILVRNANADTALVLAEKIRKKVENFLFADGIKVTISIGISVFTKGKSKETLLKEADEALYRAKALGRNKTVLFQIL